MKKRISCLLLALALSASAFGLAGCGDDKENGKKQTTNSSNGNSSTSNQEADLSFYDSIPEELKGTTVKFATWKDHKKEEAANTIADFETLTGINVELVYIPQNEYISKLTAMVTANQAPDMLVNNSEWMKLAPLLSPLEDAGVDTKDPFWDQEINKWFTIKGKVYATIAKNSLWNMGSYLTIWNKSLFEEYGIKTPDQYIKENNWTWETFRKAAKEVAGANPDFPYGAFVDMTSFTSCYNANTVSYDKDNCKYSLIDTPELKSSLKYLVGLRTDNLAKIVYNGLGTGDAFAEGRCGLAFSSGYAIRSNGYLASMNHDDLAYCYAPKKDKNDANYPIAFSARSYGICKGSKNAKAAGYFIRYFTDPNTYDWKDVYPNERAYNFIKEQQDKANYSFMPSLSTDTYTLLYQGSYLKPFFDLPSVSQVDTEVDKIVSNFKPCVEKANKIMSEVVANAK